MEFTEADLGQLVQEGLITQRQAAGIWARLTVKAPAGAPATAKAAARFDLLHVLYYSGALLIIGSMGFYTTRVWDSLDGPSISAIALAYAAIFAVAGARLWASADFKVPGGLLVTAAVSMTPLFVFGLERWSGLWPSADPGSFTGFHPYINARWIIMEAATVVVALAALRFVRFSFLTAPIGLCVWYLSMDLAEYLVASNLDWHAKARISMGLGLATLLSTFWAHYRGKKDLVYWGYLFGLMAFWGGLSSLDSNSELGKAVYCLINVGLMAVALLMNRRVFMVFGGLGVSGYLGHLAYDVFKDSDLFPFVLAATGLIIIFAATGLHRRQAQAARFLDDLLPAGLRQRLERVR